MHGLSYPLLYATGFTLVGVIGGACDLRTRRVPNWLTFPSIVLGIALHGTLDGWQGAANALIACGLILLIMFPVALRRGMGMGDIKLLLATSAFAGTQKFLMVLAASILIAGILAIAVSIRKHYLKTAIRNAFVLLRHAAEQPLTPHPELNIDNPTAHHLPFGVAVALGCILTVVLTIGGQA
ncbi:MAG: A24 family peptidase [Bacillota bacterium]|nr:A24 family peptidase [Bacillota bacterium]